MENKCMEKLDKIQKEIRDFESPRHKLLKGDESYEKIRYIKDNGNLKQRMDSMEIMESLKVELEEFLKFYTPSYMKENFYLKQLRVKDCNFIKIIGKYYYLLSCYLGDENLYRDFPAFMKALVENYTSDYENLTYEDYYHNLLKYNHIKYSEGYDTKYERNLVEHRFPVINNVYDKFGEDMRRKIPNYSREGAFWRWAERETFVNEKKYIESKEIYNTKKIVQWVSRYHGDGYGYDILSYDHENKKEKLIEVKTTECEHFWISTDEVRKAYETSKSDYCDYYIYGYIRKSDDKSLLKKLKFDKEKYYFVNIDNPEDIYYISGTLSNKDNCNGKVQLYLETKEEFDYLKNKEIPTQKVKV